MIVIATPGIKVAAAVGTLVITMLVFVDPHFMFTYAAENGFDIKFFFVPYPSFMPCCFFMAKEARVISIAAFKFNGNYIKWRMIVYAACLLIKRFAFYFNHYASFNSRLIVPATSQQFFQHRYIYRGALLMFAQQYSVSL